MYDVVFAIGPNVQRGEFQFALRSLVNLPHGKVWIFGHKPPWVNSMVGHIPFVGRNSKWRQLNDKFVQLKNLDQVSDTFYYSEDDYFITKPVDEIPNYYLQTVEERVAKQLADGKTGAYTQSTIATYEVLKAAGIRHPLSFDVHIPMLVSKSEIPVQLDNGHYLRWRTIVGNFSDRMPVHIYPDVKHTSREKFKASLERGDGFLSSNEQTFTVVGVEAYLHKLFPNKSAYER